ncbi:SOSS complex subunit C-like [Lytechinus pictus]|uniref:SOSS complex subunit C-like n=1 Tax=Lytechinus pictus TaxID=7653 RepID=UPI0030BA0223
MSAPGSSTNQVAQQNHRMAILEDLQEKKKRMSARMQSGGAGMQLKDNGMGLMRDPQEAQMSANKQQQALQHAHTNSSAYFITQDSSYGNLILPVIPRIAQPIE